MNLGALDRRPVLVALAGPNGAGKTTFHEAYLKPGGLRFVNADVLSRELDFEPYAAASVADTVRRELLRQGESFVFETVFSDPVGDKLTLLREAVAMGYSVVLCFIGLDGPGLSEERVAMRVTQGGHDVPSEKLVARFPRTLANLRRAIRELPLVLVSDNSDLRRPFREMAIFREGKPAFLRDPLPVWLAAQVNREG